MRTTLAIDDAAISALRKHAATRGLSLGDAATELILNGSRTQLTTNLKLGLPIFEVPEDFPLITDEMVRRHADDE